MKTLLALTLLAGCTSIAVADENNSGLYLGAGVGQFILRGKDLASGGTLNTEFDSDDTSFKAFAGWRFTRWLGIEADYIDFGKPSQDFGTAHVEAHINGFAPYLTGTLPLGPLEFFVKGGYMFYDVTVKVSGQKLEAASGSHDNLIVGGGVGMTLFHHLNGAIEYEHLDASQASRSDAVWLSGSWRF
jgi:hypothetical protein